MRYFEWRLQYFAGGTTEHLQGLPSALLPAHGTFLTSFALAFAMLRLLAFFVYDRSNKGLARRSVNKKRVIGGRP
jgi:hypothetical protein